MRARSLEIKKTLETLSARSELSRGSIKIEPEFNSPIPTKYQIIQTFPIFPQDYSNKGYQIKQEDGVWKVVLWPSNSRNYKAQITYFRKAIKRMLEDLEETRPYEETTISKLEIIEKKSELFELALLEICRQVTLDNSERGELMREILDQYTKVLTDIPHDYNELFFQMKKERDDMENKLKSTQKELEEQIKSSNEEIKSLRILLDMQEQWHQEVEGQIQGWKKSVHNFNDLLKKELTTQKSNYEDQIKNLTDQCASVTAERDAYRAQIDWELNQISERDEKVIQMEKKLESTQKLLEEREQALYTTRTHFERQFTFMREQMGQVLKGVHTTTPDELSAVTQYLPPRVGEQLPFLSLHDLNERIMDIYVAKIRHDAAYTNTEKPPLSEFVPKYFVTTTLGYSTAVAPLWQFLLTCGKYRHEYSGIGYFMQQLEEETASLKVVTYLALLVRKEPHSESGLPRLTAPRCLSLASKIFPEDPHGKIMEQIKRLLDRKIDQKKLDIEFDNFVSIILDILTDENQAKRERIMFQFKEISTGGNVDWPIFSDFVSRFIPHASSALICGWFLEAMKSSLPGNSITQQSFQQLVDRGIFEQFDFADMEELDVAEPIEVAKFVNTRWISDLQPIATSSLDEMRTDKYAECSSIFTELGKIKNTLKSPCVQDDAGIGLVILQKATLLLLRYKFIKIARKNSSNAQKEIKREIELLWGPS